MNACITVGTIFRRRAGLLALAGFLGSSLLAAPVPLPDWVKPIESTLPKVSPEVISEVDEICYFSAMNADHRHRPELDAQSERNARRLAELQEQADQAMIWQYLKATRDPYRNDQTLMILKDDRDLAVWLLPVVRFRIEWLNRAIHDLNMKKYVKEFYASPELLYIQLYLYSQGEFSDIEKLNILIDESVKLGFKPCLDTSSQERVRQQIRDMREVRKWSEQVNEPRWKLSVRSLVEKGILNPDALKPILSAQNPGDRSDRPEPLGPRKPLPSITGPLAFFQPWMVWAMWLGVGLISVGLLCWVFRKPKCQV